MVLSGKGVGRLNARKKNLHIESWDDSWTHVVGGIFLVRGEEPGGGPKQSGGQGYGRRALRKKGGTPTVFVG